MCNAPSIFIPTQLSPIVVTPCTYVDLPPAILFKFTAPADALLNKCAEVLELIPTFIVIVFAPTAVIRIFLL